MIKRALGSILFCVIFKRNKEKKQSTKIINHINKYKMILVSEMRSIFEMNAMRKVPEKWLRDSTISMIRQRVVGFRKLTFLSCCDFVVDVLFMSLFL